MNDEHARARFETLMLPLMNDAYVFVCEVSHNGSGILGVIFFANDGISPFIPLWITRVMFAPLIWSFRRLGASSPPICVPMLFIEGFGTRIAYRCGMNLWEDTLRTRILTAAFRIRARLGSALLEWKNTQMKIHL